MPPMLMCVVLGLTGYAAGQSKPERVESFVEFDFSTLPSGGEGTYSMTVTVFTADKDLKYSEKVGSSGVLDPASTCLACSEHMNANRFKAEVVDKTKLRVYGRIWNDKLIPATEGRVESKDLKPEELPKVKNPPKA